MSQVTTVQPLRSREYTARQLDLVKRTVAQDCNNDEFNLFVEVCKRVGLDPFRRQIYAVVYNKTKPDKRKMSIITGIDGFRAVAARCQDYRPDEDEPVITYKEELKDPAANPLGIEKASVKCHKLAPDGNWFPVNGVARWDEFAPIKQIWEYSQEQGKRVPTDKKELGGKWPAMPSLMIAKCAEAQALRRGWPEDLSGIYTPEEMEAAEVDATATEAIEDFHKEERRTLAKVKDTYPMIWETGQPIEYVSAGTFADQCLAYISAEESPTGLQHWWNTNTMALREFWSDNKNDMLAIKQSYETRLAGLETEGKENA